MDNSKDKLLEVVVGLLLQKKDITQYPNRQIAALAGVNSALINYYFQSRDNLLRTAVGVCMEDIFAQKTSPTMESSCPIAELKNMIKGIAEVAFEHYQLAEILIKQEVESGSVNTIGMIIPLLNRVFARSKSDQQIKILGLQLVVPFQSMFLNADTYTKSLGQDLWNTAERNILLDQMIDNLIKVDG